MQESPQEGDGLYAREIALAIEEFNAQERMKPGRERCEFRILGKEENSCVFRTFNAQGGMTHWYVIGGEARGQRYIAAPISLQGFGLEMRKARVFSREEIDREQVPAENAGSDALNAALERLGESLSQAGLADRRVEGICRQFRLSFSTVILFAEARGNVLDVAIHQPDRTPSHRHFSPLAEGQAVAIGRDPGNDLYFDGLSISREHCQIQFDGRDWLVRDTSSNGTYLNNQRLPRHEWVRVPE